MPKKGIGIYKRKDGRWEGQYYFPADPLTGKRKKISKYGKTEKEAKEKLLKVIGQVQTGTYISPNRLTVGLWCTEWLDTYARPKVKQSTYANYRIHIERRVIPNIGHVRLSDLRVDIIQRFFNEQSDHGSVQKSGEPLSPKTIRNLYVMLHAAFKQAYENELISKNYLDLVKLPQVRHTEMRVLTRIEHQRLWQEIQVSQERYKIGVLICLATGIRVGELVGLQWQDIDETHGILKVRRTLNRLPAMDRSKSKTEVVIDTPKSEKSIRDIPLPDFLLSALYDYRLKQYEEREQAELLQAGLYDVRDFVICNELGQPIEPRTMQDTFKRLLKAARIRNANFHALRHTFATRAVESGMEVKTLSEILGHADVSTTLNRYAHSLPEQKRQAMDAVSAFYTLPSA